MIPPLQRIHHVAYRCRDAKETVEWYERVMGMRYTTAFAEDTVPSTGDCCTWTLKTERKMEMRWQRPPMTSFSTVSSMTSTVPWAGDTIRAGSAGTTGLGSRKNHRTKAKKMNPSAQRTAARPKDFGNTNAEKPARKTTARRPFPRMTAAALSAFP